MLARQKGVCFLCRKTAHRAAVRRSFPRHPHAAIPAVSQVQHGSRLLRRQPRLASHRIRISPALAAPPRGIRAGVSQTHPQDNLQIRNQKKRHDIQRRIACRLQGEPLDARGNPGTSCTSPRATPASRRSTCSSRSRAASCKKAGQGDVSAIKEVLDRIDGKTLPGASESDDGPTKVNVSWGEPR